MKKKLFFLAALGAIALTSCTNDDFIGDEGSKTQSDGGIQFALRIPGSTRADIMGGAAATLLGNNFYVTGTKGTEQSYYPTPSLVFDNYLVHFGINTAGKTESNTANWEYVGIDQTVPTVANHVKLSSTEGAQTIKYWDFSAAQYDFFGFSTGEKYAVSKTTFTGEGCLTSDEIGVTAMLYGSGLNVESTIPTAYTFYIPTLEGLQNTFITDITEIAPASFGKEVTLKFKNLGSKIRVALYETVPGYSVKDVKFYTEDKADASVDDLGSASETDAYLIGADNNSFPTKGTVAVRFPHVGNTHASKQDYDKADATVTPATGTYDQFMSFDALTDQLVAKERAEKKWDEGTSSYIAETGNVFLGRDLPHATFAGSAAADFYQTVFPNSTAYPLTLRVDYTLVPIDGATETIKVKGAKAVVPSTYTKWLPNYAYTYVFKISDNTNGWTGTTAQSKGLFPITFDAVVAEATEATGEQTTITTVATPTITTYQQGHVYTGPTTTPDEYSKAVGKNVYVQVMDNTVSPATLKGDLNGKTPTDDTDRSLLYVITGTAPISEATVMDALENQASVAAGVITGRNGMILTPNANIDATVTSIVNGVDNNPISVTAGQAAEIDMSAVSAATYAYVYDYSTAAKITTDVYQPITAASSYVIPATEKYVTTDDLDNIDTGVAANVTTAGEAVNKNYIYFSKTTTDGGSTYTYSFVSVDGKATLPAGLVKCPVSSLTAGDGVKTVTTAGAAFVFINYTRNDGKYAVKVIKIVA